MTTTSNFSAFMMENAGSVSEETEVKLDRFSEPIILRALTAEEEEECRREARVKKDKGYEFDSIKYNNLIALKTIVVPNLNNVELQDSYGVKSGVQLLKKMFKGGELLALQRCIDRINGFDTDLVEQIKN